MLRVKEYQRNLKYYYNYYKGEIGGVFGSKTKEAVKKFQTGIADKTTVSFLNSTLKTNTSTKPTTSTSSNTKKYSKYLIYLNPGHGGNDPGAVRKVGGRVVARESDMNLRVCNSLNTYLKEIGFKTGMTRTSDKYMSLSDRANKANNAKADLYISVHFNAGGGDGLELIVHPSSSKGYKLATHLKDHITKETGQGFRRYIKRADADVRISNMPAVIIEGCFMDTSDFKLIETAEKRKKLAKAYANGIKSYIDSL